MRTFLNFILENAKMLAANHSEQAHEVVSEGAQLLRNPPTIAEKSEVSQQIPPVFLSAVESDHLTPPQSAEQRLTIAVARVSSQKMQEVLTLAVNVEHPPRVNRGGRPETLDPAARQKICLLLKLGFTRSLAAAELGISRSIVTRTMQRDEEFRQQVLQAEELFELTPLLTIVEAAQRNWRAAVCLLKHFHPHPAVTQRKQKRQLRATFNALGSKTSRQAEAEAKREIAALTQRGRKRSA